MKNKLRLWLYGNAFALLAFCEWNPTVTGKFRSQTASNAVNRWFVPRKPEQVAQLLVIWDVMTLMAWTNNNSGMVLQISIHAFCYRSISETSVAYHKAVDKNIARHTAHNIVSWPAPEQWLLIHISHLRIRWSINVPKLLKEKRVNKKHTAPHIA